MSSSGIVLRYFYLHFRDKLNLELANSVCWPARILQGASYLHLHSTGITLVQYPTHNFNVGAGCWRSDQGPNDFMVVYQLNSLPSF